MTISLWWAKAQRKMYAAAAPSSPQARAAVMKDLGDLDRVKAF